MKKKYMVIPSILIMIVMSAFTAAPFIIEPNDTLSQTEIDGLLFMREEEKLAHDVYVYLYDLWGMQVFQNIAGSEQSHTEAVKSLLDLYGIADPTIGQVEGSFVNSDLQSLYDQLISQGSQSLEEALKVGAAIEEIDILDLQEMLSQTSNPDITRVYEILLKGSNNHLRAFTRTLQNQSGEVYEAQFMDSQDYEAIISSQNGGRGGSGRSSNTGSRGQGLGRR
ncbi:MAG: DUF2202 domain-containing protein [Anaerolineaceae bacterium]|nr:DUF2202 domain-containing protein [Anaerolineaceae bacterium]